MKNLLIKIFTLSLALCILCNFQSSSLDSSAFKSELFDEATDFFKNNSDKDFEDNEPFELARFNSFDFNKKSSKYFFYQKQFSYKEIISSVTTPPPDIA